VKRRLGAWWRLGIVLTAFWMVGGTVYFAALQIDELTDTIESSYGFCLSQAPPRASAVASCSDEMTRGFYSIDRGTIWLQALGIAAVLAVLAWMVFGILYGSTLWILAGRKAGKKSE